MPRLTVALLLLAAVPLPAAAQNDAGSADAPVAVWRFDGAAEPGLSPADAKFREPGPRPPAYPAFGAGNTALAFTAAHPAVTVREADLSGARLRFGNGDAITLEAWVRVAELKDGSYAYVVGKGRTRRPGFPELNQNYALRLKGEKGEARVSFLFSSAPGEGKPAEWHRWTTTKGFTPGGWHHVAVAYTFGEPTSVRGYIDGVSLPGTWDMGGATKRAPVSDADDLVIGTGNGGGAGNSFRGLLDDVTIWRTASPTTC